MPIQRGRPETLQNLIITFVFRKQTRIVEQFSHDLEKWFGKCSLFVLSANDWKDQNMVSSFSRQRKPIYGEGIVQLANRVAVWRQSEVSVDLKKVLGRDVF